VHAISQRRGGGGFQESLFLCSPQFFDAHHPVFLSSM
jgi:hypothetical protein